MSNLTTGLSPIPACKTTLAIAVPGKPSPNTPLNQAAPQKQPDSDKISSSARQLSDALQRAKQRDASLNRDQLRSVAEKSLAQIHSVRLATPHAVNDNERPATDDPEILDRARKATAFKNNAGPNPFKGMAPELLAAITYDDSGTFTLHERRAAWSESYDQREAWSSQVAAGVMLEYRLTGNITKAYGQMLDHHRNQTPIEQAQMPDNHEKDLLQKITSILSSPEQWHDISLYDVLRRWLTQPHQQSLFSIMANEGQVPEPTLPSLDTQRPNTPTGTPNAMPKASSPATEALAVKIAVQKALAPHVNQAAKPAIPTR